MKGNRKRRTLLFTAAATLIFGIVPLPSFSGDSFPAVQVYERMSPSVVLIVSKFDQKASLIGAGSIIDGKDSAPSGHLLRQPVQLTTHRYGLATTALSSRGYTFF